MGIRSGRPGAVPGAVGIGRGVPNGPSSGRVHRTSGFWDDTERSEMAADAFDSPSQLRLFAFCLLAATVALIVGVQFPVDALLAFPVAIACSPADWRRRTLAEPAVTPSSVPPGSPFPGRRIEGRSAACPARRRRRMGQPH